MAYTQSARRVSFALLVLIFGGAIVAVSTINGRGPMKAVERLNDAPMGKETMYFTQDTFKPAHSLFADQLDYYLYRPVPPYAPTAKFPLVLVLHDAQGIAPTAQYLITQQMRHYYPAFVLVPVIPKKNLWAFPGAFARGVSDKNKRIQDAVALVRHLMQEMPIDPARIYVMGCAEGGYGTFGALRYFPDLFAAGVVQSGGWRATDARELTKRPVWMFHGRNDPFYPVATARSIARGIHNGGGNVKYFELPDMQRDCFDRRLYANAMWAWLFSQHHVEKIPAAEIIPEEELVPPILHPDNSVAPQ